MKAPAQEVERGKTVAVSPVSPAQSGRDPPPDAWGEWLTRNGKGRVRVIGGLEATNSHDNFKHLGSIVPSSGESVGKAAADTPTSHKKVDMETNKNSSDAVALITTCYTVSSVTGRSRDIRDLMSEHIAAGTVCPNSDSILEEARDLIDVMRDLQAKHEASTEALENLYLCDKCSYDDLQEVQRSGAELKYELSRWDAEVPPPSEETSEPASLCSGAEAPVSRPKSLWRSGRMSFQGPPRV